jgi:hypothetical protein
MEHKPLPAKRDRSNENLTRTIERLIRRCDKISLRGNFDVYLLVRRNNRYYEYNSASDSSFPASIDEIVSSLMKCQSLRLTYLFFLTKGRSFPRPVRKTPADYTIKEDSNSTSI